MNPNLNPIWVGLSQQVGSRLLGVPFSRRLGKHHLFERCLTQRYCQRIPILTITLKNAASTLLQLGQKVGP